MKHLNELQDKIDDLINRTNTLLAEVAKQHPTCHLPEDEALYLGIHNLRCAMQPPQLQSAITAHREALENVRDEMLGKEVKVECYSDSEWKDHAFNNGVSTATKLLTNYLKGGETPQPLRWRKENGKWLAETNYGQWKITPHKVIAGYWEIWLDDKEIQDRVFTIEEARRVANAEHLNKEGGKPIIDADAWDRVTKAVIGEGGSDEK